MARGRGKSGKFHSATPARRRGRGSDTRSADTKSTNTGNTKTNTNT
jgi:hypothetical protein